MPKTTSKKKLPNVDIVIKMFREQEPGFTDFEHTQSEDITWIRNSHSQGLVKGKAFLDELRKDSHDKDEFTTLLGKLLNSVPYYFDWREVMHWRDASLHEGFPEECTNFLKALPIRNHEAYEHYSSYFLEQGIVGFASVNYFILYCHFVYDPKTYCAMKVSRLEAVLKLLGVNIKLSGHLIDFAQFMEINDICSQLYKDLTDLHPKDMSDVSIFMHIVGENCISKRK